MIAEKSQLKFDFKSYTALINEKYSSATSPKGSKIIHPNEREI